MKVFHKVFLIGLFLFQYTGSGSGKSALQGPAIQSNQVVTIKARPHSEVKVAVISPDGEPKGVILMLPGGNGCGTNSFTAKPGGEIALGDNFVVRTAPEFVRQGYVVAIMDAPSDHAGGMDPEFRRSKAHHQDIIKTVKYLNSRYKRKPLYPAAFCVSNISLISLAARNPNLRVSGLILISGMWKGAISKGSIGGQLALPYAVLIVHHKLNKCEYCLIDGTYAFYALLETKGRKDLVVAQGGTPSSDANVCGPFHYHGYEGMENKVVRTIVDWMGGKKVPKEI